MPAIDLTIPMQHGAIESCPGEPLGFFLPFANMEQHGWVSHQLLLYTHGGTHVDAPSHFLKDGSDVASLSTDALMGDALVADVDISGDSFSLDDIHWPAAPEAGSRIILRTGWEKQRGHREYFTQSPGLGLDIARYLKDRGVVLLGLDLPTPNREYPREVHEILLGSGIVVVEALTNLTQIPGHFGQLICLPLPLVGLDGSPARVLFVPGSDE